MTAAFGTSGDNRACTVFTGNNGTEVRINTILSLKAGKELLQNKSLTGKSNFMVITHLQSLYIILNQQVVQQPKESNLIILYMFMINAYAYAYAYASS